MLTEPSASGEVKQRTLHPQGYSLRLRLDTCATDAEVYIYALIYSFTYLFFYLIHFKGVRMR